MKYENLQKFFNLRTNCPTCHLPLVRHFRCTFMHDSTVIEYISEPNMDQYSNLGFKKDQYGMRQAVLTDGVKFTDSMLTPASAPSLISFKEGTPPSIAFLKIRDAWMTCQNTREYYLWNSTISEEEPTLERFIVKDLDIVISKNNIKELANNIEIPTTNSHILKYSSTQIVNKIKKVIMLS